MIHLAEDLGKFWSRTEWIGLVHLEEALGKKGHFQVRKWPEKYLLLLVKEFYYEPLKIEILKRLEEAFQAFQVLWSQAP